MPYAIDLFSGAGGMSEGLIQAGFHILFSSDISEDVENTYVERHEQLGLRQGVNTFFYRTDISELTGEFIFDSIQNLEIFRGNNIPEIDAIFGGPPCQGFSLAGRRNNNDPRNLLFREYIRVIDEVRPKYVVMENVAGFLNTRLNNYVGLNELIYDDNTLITTILEEELDHIQYSVLPVRLLDASHFGVPQRRKRAIFIAYRDGVTPPQYPEVNLENIDIPTVHDAISDLANIAEEGNIELSEYQRMSKAGRTPTIQLADRNRIIFGPPIASEQIILNNEKSNHRAAITQRFNMYNEGENTSALFNRILNEGLDNVLFNYIDLLVECFERQTIYEDITSLATAIENATAGEEIVKLFISKKGNRIKFDRNAPSSTIVTLPDDYIIPYENRIPTVRELARLQSFDDSFRFTGKRTTGGPRRRVEVPQYTQVGNAVPPLLAKAVAEQVLVAIRQTAARHH